MVREVQVVIWDDLDHYQHGIDTRADDTIRFSWEGSDWEIDLTEAHYKEMAEALRPWLECARPVKAEKPRLTSRTGGGTKSRTRQLNRIRKWANENGYGPIDSTGRVPYDVHHRYNEHHPDDFIPLADNGKGTASRRTFTAPTLPDIDDARKTPGWHGPPQVPTPCPECGEMQAHAGIMALHRKREHGVPTRKDLAASGGVDE